MIETDFDIAFIGDLALHEKQIQQNYRPIIAIHKWFARRPGTLFRGILLAEFVRGSLKETFFRGHNLGGLRIVDPFMGGGTPLVEANRVGCDIIGYDINPMAYWIVRQEIEHLDVRAYLKAADALRRRLHDEVGAYYATRCVKCGSEQAHVKYFLWVKTLPCDGCGHVFDLFPGYVLAENRRHPAHVIICSACGELNEVEDLKNLRHCKRCGDRLRTSGVARQNRSACPKCGKINAYPRPSDGPLTHRMVAIEYYCPSCKPSHVGRFFKAPDAEDLAKYESASARWAATKPEYVPEDEIPRGDETDRLHRWGYRKYREMFNDRQLLGLEASCRAIAEEPTDEIRNALATNLSDLLRYQNMLCRYDAMALKSLDVFSVHGFPVGLLQCESNILGIVNGEKGLSVGSGGWSNIIDKYARAKAYCQDVFEVKHQGNRKTFVHIKEEWIGEAGRVSGRTDKRNVELHCGSATVCELPQGSIDAVFTDPPYFTNVQYAELMDFCYVWLRRLARTVDGCLDKASTRDQDELTGNTTMERGLEHFTEGLSAVFTRMATALKPGSPLVFTYHHNTIEAYFPVAVAILDAGLKCSASIPCPAEMGASIHINGTGSSIVDTVFVCRSQGTVSRRTIGTTAPEIAEMVRSDLKQLRAGNLKPTRGDMRCVAYGHLVRLAMWNLRNHWDRDLPTIEKLARMRKAVDELGGWPLVEKALGSEVERARTHQNWVVSEPAPEYEARDNGVSF